MEFDDKVLTDVVGRLRKVEGQIGGIIRMIESGRECADVVMQLSAASRGLDRAGFRLLASGLRQCITDREGGARSDYDEEALERLFLKLA